MNQIRLRDLNAVVEDLKTSLKSNVDDAKVRQIAKSELNKILKNLPKGVDESQILPILEKEFKGEKNKQRIIEEVINLLGKENFKNGKFVGG
jgi:Ca2+-binding EF-hand superfamily protein